MTTSKTIANTIHFDGGAVTWNSDEPSLAAVTLDGVGRKQLSLTAARDLSMALNSAVRDVTSFAAIAAAVPKTTVGNTTPTAREMDVFRLLTVRGLSNKMLARELGISEGTVKLHVTALLKKCGVSSRAELVAAHHTSVDIN